ncbi:unnamed protein product [Boreogadus saida]
MAWNVWEQPSSPPPRGPLPAGPGARRLQGSGGAWPSLPQAPLLWPPFNTRRSEATLRPEPLPEAPLLWPPFNTRRSEATLRPEPLPEAPLLWPPFNTRRSEATLSPDPLPEAPPQHKDQL